MLFDANHALWFVDFLFDLFGYLNKKLPPESSAPFYVILDNAPGQSELLPLLQERLLRWGTHRAKFLQVATLDEMDIRASLEVLAHIQQRAATIHQTKKVIAEHGPNTSSSDWGNLLAVHGRDGIDRELLLELLTDGSSAIKAVCDECCLEEKYPCFMILILNRVFETLDLGRVDEFILERVGKLEVPFLDVPRVAFPFDPALGLFFQELFRATPPRGSKPATTSVHESTPPEPPATLPNTAEQPENQLRRLAELDLNLYRNLYSRKVWLDASAARRTLVRVFTVGIASHLYRGLDVCARLFDLSHRILRACRPDIPQPAPDGLLFRTNMLNVLVVRMEEEMEKEATDFNLWDDIQGARFLNALIPGKTDQTPVITAETQESFARSRAENGGFRSIAHRMIAGLFPIFGAFVAYPDQIEPKSGVLKSEFLPFFTELYAVADMVLQEALNRESAQALCDALDQRFSSHQTQKFNLELGDVMERLRLFDISLNHGETSSNMLLTLLKQFPTDGSPLTELAELYLHTALAGLFQGLRTDHERVRTEILNLLTQSSGDAPRDLAARIEQRLGKVVDHLFAAGADHADH